MKRNQILSGAVFVVLVSGLIACISMKGPQFPEGMWPTSTPEAQGMDSEKLQLAIDLINEKAGPKGAQHTVIIRNGAAIFQGDSADMLVDTRCNPMFLVLAAGLLLDDGKYQMNDPAKNFESRLDCEYEEYGRIQVEHFLTRTSGYDAEGGRFHWGKIDGSLTPFVPGKPLAEPGTALSSFHDSGNMMALVLTKIAHEPLDGLVRSRIMRPIGIADEDWRWSDFGEIDGIKVNKEGENGFLITADAFAKVGYLLLNNGNWAGKQILSQAFVETATTPQIPFEFELAGHYGDVRGHMGYHFLINKGHNGGEKIYPDLPDNFYYFKQWRTNILFVIPEWDMVIVRIADEENRTMGLWKDDIGKLIGLVGDAIVE